MIIELIFIHFIKRIKSSRTYSIFFLSGWNFFMFCRIKYRWALRRWFSLGVRFWLPCPICRSTLLFLFANLSLQLCSEDKYSRRRMELLIHWRIITRLSYFLSGLDGQWLLLSAEVTYFSLRWKVCCFHHLRLDVFRCVSVPSQSSSILILVIFQQIFHLFLRISEWGCSAKWVHRWVHWEEIW